MARFLDLIQALRVHSWMRCFGHPLPKPSVFMSNIKDQIVGLLRRQWSAKMEALWQEILGTKLMSVMATRNLWINKSKKLQDSIEVSLESKIEADQVRKVFLQNPPVQEQQQKIRFRRETFERFWDLHSRFLPGCFRCLADSSQFTFQRIYFRKSISGKSLEGNIQSEFS